MRSLKITLGLLTIIIGLSFHYFQIKSSLDFFSPKHHGMQVPTPVFTTSGTTSGKNAIRVALLLDTSGSMEGLIEQTKSQLWNILNELSRTKKNGDETQLEIALYEYGNPSRGNNQISKLSGFTTDMDLISEKLFALTTNGGEEYCGQVIQTSLSQLDWGTDPDDLKIIYIAGNEPFTQGPVNYAFACQQAKEKGISINTIFCGDYQEGINTSWQAGAIAGRGIYMHIDHNQQTAYIETPYDNKINQLNNKLNNTYIPYGEDGQRRKQNQLQQDFNASSYSSTNAADRAAFKSSKKYRSEEWDLVDAYRKDKAILKNTSHLPDTLQNISTEEMEAKIQAVISEREAIQQQIKELDQKRRLFKSEKSKDNNDKGLQHSMLKSIRKQAEEKGYEF